jgi:hypothetical protein
MPRKTHPNTRRSRRYTRTDAERATPTPDQLARRLVEKGLASPQIIEGGLVRPIEPMHAGRAG